MLAEGVRCCERGEALEPALVRGIASLLVSPDASLEDKVTFLRAYQAKGETPEELSAFALQLLPLSVSCGIRGHIKGKPLFDCCGTGGGGLNIVNVSTAIMPILAAGGVPVVKHGNRGVTKKSGSADVLEAMDIRLEVPPDKIRVCLEECGMAFLMAPLFHPAFKHVAEARKILAAEGKRTVFNLLGPLLNPCVPQTQLMGVFQSAHLELFQKALNALEREHFLVVFGRDADGTPLGEVSVTGDNEVRGWLDDAPCQVLPLRKVSGSRHEMEVEGREASAERIMAVLKGEEMGLLRHMILVNAATGFYVNRATKTLSEGLMLAAEQVDSGKALQTLEKFKAITAALCGSRG